MIGLHRYTRSIILPNSFNSFSVSRVTWRRKGWLRNGASRRICGVPAASCINLGSTAQNLIRPIGIETPHAKLQDTMWFAQYSNRVHLEYNSKALPLQQTAWTAYRLAQKSINRTKSMQTSFTLPYYFPNLLNLFELRFFMFDAQITTANRYTNTSVSPKICKKVLS
jgi:hypothetical protein